MPRQNSSNLKQYSKLGEHYTLYYHCEISSSNCSSPIIQNYLTKKKHYPTPHPIICTRHKQKRQV